MVEIIKDQYLNDIDEVGEIEENPEDFNDDYRTLKEQQDDMGDYLKDREYDWKMSGDFNE
ncbi:MAG: hypothetical protein ACYC0T_21750 [Ramlibacter sp.]